jgi:hypothetical protein
VHDHIQEITPASRVILGVTNLLAAEPIHGSEVIAEFLIFKSWNGHFGQIYDKVIANDLVVFDVAFKFRDLVKHGLHLGGLFPLVFEHSLECELTLIHLIDGFLPVFDLFDGVGARSFDPFLAGDGFNEGLQLHQLTLDPVPHVFEGILNVFCLFCHIISD